MVNKTGFTDEWDLLRSSLASPLPAQEVGDALPIKQSSRPLHISPEAFYLSAILRMDRTTREEMKRAQIAIDRHGSLINLLNTSTEELSQDDFLGRSGAMKIELAKRLIFESAFAALKNKPMPKNLDQLVHYLFLTTGHAKREIARILALDVKNQILMDERLSTGTPTFVHFEVKEAVAFAARSQAVSIVLVHNHPSGDPDPSEVDIRLTNQVYGALMLIEVKLLDHIILAPPRWTSLRNLGMIA